MVRTSDQIQTNLQSPAPVWEEMIGPASVQDRSFRDPTGELPRSNWLVDNHRAYSAATRAVIAHDKVLHGHVAAFADLARCHSC